MEGLHKGFEDLSLEDGGETLRLGALSPGCRACKNGRWECVFLTMECCLECDFCLTPETVTNCTPISMSSNEALAKCRELAAEDLDGVAFSGGEPMLAGDVLVSCIGFLRRERSDLHLWVYTNGLLVTNDWLDRLANSGLDEIRFNMAAVGYQHDEVMKMLAAAGNRSLCVTVEIPAIPDHASLLLEALPAWNEHGVRHLNLHDLIFDPGSPSGLMKGDREVCRMPDDHICAAHPNSVDLVADVLDAVSAEGLDMSVNYCSMFSKMGQFRERRRRIAARTLESHEQWCGGGEAESICLYNDERCEFVHPDSWNPDHMEESLEGAALVRRMLPLHAEGRGEWTHFEILWMKAGK